MTRTIRHRVFVGGDGGAEIVAAGTPEDIVKVKRSYTGEFLKPVLERESKRGKKRVEAAEEGNCAAFNHFEFGTYSFAMPLRTRRILHDRSPNHFVSLVSKFGLMISK